MPFINISVDFPDDLGRSLGELIDAQTKYEDSREYFVTQIRLQDAKRRAYTGDNPDPQRCESTDCLILSSSGKTRNGIWEFDVRQSLCYEVEVFGEPNIVASPVLNNPIITSVGYFISHDNTTLILRVSTMNTNGGPIDAYFHWQAIIPFSYNILI